MASNSPGSTSRLPQRLKDPQDGQAWADLSQKFLPILRRVWQNLGGLPNEVEDLLQEVLFKVYRSLEAFDRRGPGSFRRWIHCILRNAAKDRNELNRRRREKGEAILESAPSREGDVSDVAALREFERILRDLERQAVERVRAQFREPKNFDAYCLQCEGVAAKTVMKQLEIPADSVYKAKERGKRLFAKEREQLIKQHLPELFEELSS